MRVPVVAQKGRRTSGPLARDSRLLLRARLGGGRSLAVGTLAVAPPLVLSPLAHFGSMPQAAQKALQAQKVLRPDLSPAHKRPFLSSPERRYASVSEQGFTGSRSWTFSSGYP